MSLRSQLAIVAALASICATVVVSCGAAGNNEPSSPEENALTAADRAPLPPELRVVELVVAGPIGCGRTANGRVACWAADELIRRDADCEGSPVERCRFEASVSGVRAARWIPGVTDARSIALGGVGAAIRANGGVVFWPLAGATELEPRPIEGLTDATQLALGLMFGCALRRNGEVWCWGDDRRYRAVGEPGWSRATRRGNLTEIIHIDADLDSVCATTATGAAACWGDNSGDVLGAGIAAGQASAEPVPIPEVDDALQVQTDHNLSCALRRGGRVTCWGASSPGGVLATIDDAHSLALARNRGCAVRRTGRVACWDSNAESVFEPALSGIENVATVALERHNACALLESGALLCWTAFGRGERGDDSTAPTSGPVRMTGVRDARAIALGMISCVLRRGGRVACWGPGYGPTPVAVPMPPP